MAYQEPVKLTTEQAKHPVIKAIIAATFPSYNGRKIKVQVQDYPLRVESYWSGGSRDYFAAFNFNTQRATAVPQNGTPFDGGPIAPNGVLIPQHACIVRHSIFCGKDSGLTILVNPTNKLTGNVHGVPVLALT